MLPSQNDNNYKVRFKSFAQLSIPEHSVEVESLSKDVVTLLTWLCDKLEAAQAGTIPGGPPHTTVPLLLDGIHAVLSKVPNSLQDRPDFVDLVWCVSYPVGGYLYGILRQESKAKF